jgi:adenosylhomocysteine nucleosidase
VTGAWGGDPVIAVAGLAFEARIAEGPGVKVVYGQNRIRLVEEIDRLARAGARGIISFGVAGGLAPGLNAGGLLVAASVITATGRYCSCPDWSRALLTALPFAQLGDIAGVDETIVSPAGKSALWNATGAAAVDMESHVAAKIAADYKLPFIALRAVLDPAHRAIPSSALAGTREDGVTDAGAVLKALVQRPHEWGAMIRLAQDARKANAVLVRSRKALGPYFGLLGARKLPLGIETVETGRRPALAENNFGGQVAFIADGAKE